MSADAVSGALFTPHANADDAVYAWMEALLVRGLRREQRIEVARTLAEVAALLSSRGSEFSDTAMRPSPMGREPAAH